MRQYPDRPPMEICDECGHFCQAQNLLGSTDGGQTWTFTRILTCHRRDGQPGRRCKERFMEFA